MLRLAKNPVGRLLTTLPTWAVADMNALFGQDKDKAEQAQKLLTVRGQITAQAGQAEQSLVRRVDIRKQKADGSLGRDVDADEVIRKAEQDVKLRTVTIRGLLDDMKKLADEIEPPAKKNADPPLPTDPKAKLQALRDQLKVMEKDEKDYADLKQT